MKTRPQNHSLAVLMLTGVLCTVAVNPWFAFDPINLPKMFFLSLGAAILLAWIIFEYKIVAKTNRTLLTLLILFSLFLFSSFLLNLAPWYQQLWGTWGRSTGLITYLSFSVLILYSALISDANSLRKVRGAFERLGYFISFYTIIQLMEIDPINWSQKALVATLGNINFMSSFLGLTSISYLSRALFERMSWSSRLFFLFISMGNLFLILVSRSIQGIAVLLAGLTILLTFEIRKRWDLAKSILFLCLTGASGALLFLGSAGFGPFSFFRQETVIFRLDYWRAAINMISANPLIGIGLDSYGDFYREFRTSEAVIRTGPQRVTNTAHNIFLDVFSGAGVFAGILILLIMLIALKKVFDGLKTTDIITDYYVFCAMWIGFIIFCCISINQIGVGVWGFIFTGLVIGFQIDNATDDNSREKTNRKAIANSAKENLSLASQFLAGVSQKTLFQRVVRILIGCSLVLSVGLATLLPNLADAKFSKSMKSQDLQIAIDMFDDAGVQDFHREQSIQMLLKQNRNEDALRLAHDLTELNRNNWFAWVTIFTNPESTYEERELASRELLRMDPNNLGLKGDVTRILSDK